MLFNSIEFALFLPVVFILYWLVLHNRLRAQNVFLLISSYVFYGWWDWKFLTLIIASTLVDYLVGIGLSATDSKRKRNILLGISLAANLGMLGYFKYCNFFIESFAEAFKFFGQSFNVESLKIILPVGISFYTFQTLSYSIDVYKKELTATRDFISFSAFVSFFPQLVAGPIERASHLLPQFYQKRIFNRKLAEEGLRQILWGLFKKVVIADQCAVLVNQIFSHPEDYNGSTLVLGAILFAFQIYGDFSGYSDIAVGTSRLFGFDLMQNFNYPYFSRDMAEFWRRWHISLSTWFRDYLYIPLGGSRVGKWLNIRNIFIVFIVSGLWHGARWNFVFWGLLHALFYLPLLILHKSRNHLNIVAQNRKYPTFSEFLAMISTFMATTFAWIFFRTESLNQALGYIGGIFNTTLFSLPDFEKLDQLIVLIILLFGFILIEWKGRENIFSLAASNLPNQKVFRWSIYLLLAMLIFIFHGKGKDFIYFQF